MEKQGGKNVKKNNKNVKEINVTKIKQRVNSNEDVNVYTPEKYGQSSQFVNRPTCTTQFPFAPLVPQITDNLYHEAPSPAVASSKTSDISLFKRPGTPALIQSTDDSAFDKKYDDSVNKTLLSKSSETKSENYASFNKFYDSSPTNAYQPPQLYSFLATALQGNSARSLARHVAQENKVFTNFQVHQENRQVFHNLEQVQHLARQSHEVYNFQKFQSNDSLDVNRFATNNENFNHLTYNMVRLKNGEDSDDKDDESKVPNGDEYLEDGEGNHECHNLARGLNQDSNGRNLEHSDGAATPCIGQELNLTPVTNNLELNNFATLGASIYQGEWPINRALWMSGPSSIGEKDSLSGLIGDDTESIMSFSSSTAAGTSHSHSHHLGSKVEMVYSLLSMLGSSSKDDMSKTLLEMSNNRESCIAMRQSGCLPLLVQLLHGTDHDYVLSEQDPNSLRWALREARRRASQALHNIVYAHPDDKRGRREARVLRLLEQIRDYSDYLKEIRTASPDVALNENLDLHPGPAIAALMKLSFDEEHRHAMCLLGGLQAIAELIQADYEVHGNTNDQFCITVRRYAGMALTNLTFGDGTNKALLCSMKSFMQALVAQLHSPNEDLRQVTASVLRNLSWRADAASKQILREVGAVTTLMKTSMKTNKESTLKSILSALWNLSAHCSVNKADICAIDGALEFLVSTLTYKSSLKTLSIVENGGGILRNISSHIAVKEEYRAILRKHNCLQTLLRHLKSPSLTVVSNACGTLWNLSARCQQDQQALWEMGAVGMLRNLIHSKHKMISMGSAAALKNLLAARPPKMGFGLCGYLENGHHQPGSQSNSPSLLVRKQRALEADIDQNLSETCDNIDSPKTSPTSTTNKSFNFDSNGIKPHYLSYLPGRMYHSINGHVTSPLYVPRSESRDSLGSTHSEPPHYRAQCERFRILVNANRQLPLDLKTVQEKPDSRTGNSFEMAENTNIVMQLFRSLHDNSVTSMNNNSQNLHLSENRNTPPKSSNFPTVKMGVWEVPNPKISKIENKNIALRNGDLGEVNKNMDRHESSLKQSNISSQLKYASHHEKNQSAKFNDVNEFLELPDNKRPLNKENAFNSSQNSNCLTSPLDVEKIKSNHQNSDAPSENDVSNNHTISIHENVVLRKKIRSDISHWSSTSTLKEPDSDDTDQTPLAVSRCSSLSSLASCLQQSARNSWISDVSSRRTSGIISPSDIPDSPSLEIKHCVSRFTDKAPDAESLGIPRPRPAWPLGVNTVSNSNILPTHHEMPFELNLSINQEEGSEKRPLLENNSVLNMNEHLKESCRNRKENIAEELPNNIDINNVEHNNSRLHSRVNNLSASFSYARSNIPVKSNNVRLTQSVPNVLKPSVLSSCATAILLSNTGHIPGNNLETCNLVSRSKQFNVCDDNDNLLFRCQNSGNSKTNVGTYSGSPQNLLHQNLQYNNTLKNSGKPVSLTDSPSILPHNNNHGFRRYSPRHDNNKNQNSFFKSGCYSHAKKLQICDISANSETSSYAFLKKTNLFTKSSISEESSLNVDHASQDKRKSKVKTSIPQIIKPWHPNIDNEVHPKQLQIMSQNLPVYKGPFTVHKALGSEKTNADQEETNKDETQQNITFTNELSDPSSPSADSELSSTELLQECISAARVSKINRSKSKRNKQGYHSSEIKRTSDHSSDDGEKLNINENTMKLEYLSSIQWNEIKKSNSSERAQEKDREYVLSVSTIPDLLEGAACHADIAAKKSLEGRQIISSKSNEVQKGMSDSLELRKGAFLIAAELEEIADDHTNSSASCFSDLDNIKPPSVMGEMSMTSSGLSDLLSNGNGNGKCYLNGKNHVDRRRNLKRIKKANGNHRFVFKSVLQTRDITRTCENSEIPSSITGSIENLSMRSSGTSEILDNINPPSVMDDISMTNSCASLNSINSDILESRSQSLADPRSDSEMFQRLNAAAAMVQVYSRELNNIMTGSMKSSCNSDMKSSCNSDNLDQIKPPSVFQDIAEVTVEDGTEVGSDAMISDSELEEDLPHDDEGSIPSTETVHSPVHALNRTEPTEGSTENLNSSFESDSVCHVEKPHHSIKRISTLALTPQNASIINIDSNTVQHSVNSLACSENVTKHGDSSDFNYISIPQAQSNHSTINEDQIKMNSSPPIRRGARIVKPITRDTIRQMQEKKATERHPRSGHEKIIITPKVNGRSGSSNKPTTLRKNVLVTAVRPTRTSALRASQSQKQVENKYNNGGRTSPRSFLSKPPVTKVNQGIKITSSTSSKPTNNVNNNQVQTVQKPMPLVKQGTFTKDEPTQNTPLISPKDSSNIPEFSTTKSQVDINSSELNKSNSGDSASLKSRVSKEINNGNTTINNGKVRVTNTSKFKRSTSNYVLQRNISLPLQKRENLKSSLRPSPSTHSFGGEKDNEKPSDCNNSRSATFCRSSLSSLSSNSLKRANSQKEVASKISSIWKKSENNSLNNSPITDTSTSERTSSFPVGKSKVVKTQFTVNKSTSLSQDPRKNLHEKRKNNNATEIRHQNIVKSVSSRASIVYPVRSPNNLFLSKKSNSTVKLSITSTVKTINNISEKPFSSSRSFTPSQNTHKNVQMLQKDASSNDNNASNRLSAVLNEVLCTTENSDEQMDSKKSDITSSDCTQNVNQLQSTSDGQEIERAASVKTGELVNVYDEEKSEST